MTAYAQTAINGHTPQLGDEMTAPDCTPPGGPDWAAIRLAYDTTETPLRILSGELGFSLSTFHHKRRREGWTTRRERALLAPRAELPKPRPAVDWARVRLDYEKGEISVTEICARHRIGSHRLQKRKRDDGWEPRRAAYPQAFGAGGTINTARQLKHLLAHKLAALAKHLPPDEKIDPADPLKGLLTLASAYQKLVDSEAKEELRDAGERSRHPAITDAARLALAGKLEALADSWLAAGSPPDTLR